MMTLLRCAPRAMRTPISRVRCAVANARTPYSPTEVMSRASAEKLAARNASAVSYTHLEGDVRYLLIRLGNAQKSQVWAQAKTGQQLLLGHELNIGGDLRIKSLVGAVESLAIVVPDDLNAAAGWERLRIGHVSENRVVVEDRHIFQSPVGE